jgi:hypothetical protein
MRSAAWITIGLFIVAATDATAASRCDRDCLNSALDRYLHAIITHEPHAAPLAGKFHYTENAIRLTTREGLWNTATALGKVQRRYFDPASGQAAYFGFVEEGAETGIATVRIRVVEGKITEGETIVGRKIDGTFSPEGLLAQPPPEKALGVQGSREVLLKAAATYFEGLANSDGSSVVHQKGCYRIENGLALTGRPIRDAKPDSTGEVPKTDCATLGGFKATISGVSHRRFPLIDQQAGVVLGMGILERPPGAKRPDGSIYPRNLLTEYFVMEDGQIRGIYAAMHYMTPDLPDAPGWP